MAKPVIGTVTTMTQKKSLVDREVAYLAYLKLGPSRNLTILLKTLKEKYGEDAPSYGSLKAWRKKDNWNYRAGNDDASVYEQVVEDVMPEMIKERADMLSAVHAINTDIDWLISGIYTLDKFGDPIRDEHGHPITKIFVEDVRDLEKLLSVRLRAVEIELKLRGEPSKSEVAITGIEFVPARYECDKPALKVGS